jgi:polyisoprenoid-binding protein YceI
MLKNVLTFAITAIFATTMLTATVFTVDNGATKVKWHAEKVTGKHDGHVKIKSGTLNFDNGKLKDGEFTINMKSISNTDIEDPSYKAKLENHLKSDDFFSVKKFPEAKFSITKVEEKSGKHHITGDLTIKGITHPVSFPAEISVNGDKVTAKADIIVDRSKYDVRFRSKSFFDINALGDNLIYDEFTISLDLVAKK